MDKSPLQSSRRPYSPRHKRAEWISRVFFLPSTAVSGILHSQLQDRPFSQPRESSRDTAAVTSISDVRNRPCRRRREKKNERKERKKKKKRTNWRSFCFHRETDRSRYRSTYSGPRFSERAVAEMISGDRHICITRTRKTRGSPRVFGSGVDAARVPR